MEKDKKQTAFDLYRVTPSEIKNSSAWFNEKIAGINKQKIKPNTLISESKGLTNVIVPGRMYAFLYDPKTKETLPYYDTFPLILPYDKSATHFIGLNLHYLDYPIRFELLKALIKTTGMNINNPRAKMQYDWGLIKSVAKLGPAKACIKSYLIDQVRSPFMEIATKDWYTASILPFHSFQKSSAKSVWKDSRGKF
jgi:hypothetical protein